MRHAAVRLMLIALAGIVALPFAPAAHAADLTAATEAELVAAIAAVNAAGAGTHTITLTADIALTAPPPPLDNPAATGLTLDGGGHMLNGNGHGPVLSVAAGTTAAIRAVTVTGGAAERGGGIHSAGSLSIANSTISGNTADRGGGVYVEAVAGRATLSMTDSIVTGNEAAMGGGLHAHAAGGHVAGVALTRVAVRYNRATADGGGIGLLAQGDGVVNLTMTGGALFQNAGQQGGGLGSLADGGRVSANVIRATVEGNRAAAGGGLFHGAQNGGGGELDVVYSTLAHNQATNAGGGIANWARGGGTAQLTLFNATLSQNRADVAGGGLHSAVAGGSAAANVAYSTLAGNTAGAEGGGGGIHTVASGGASTATLTATIVSNSAGDGPDCARPSGSIISTGYNLAGDGTCYLLQGSDQPATLPGLEPLALNPPGLTATHGLRFAGAAVDRIPPGAAGCGTIITTDQRGAPRPAGERCDVGAFEQGPDDVIVYRVYVPVAPRP